MMNETKRVSCMTTQAKLKIVLLSLLVIGCQQSPESLAKNHLELLRSGKMGEANQQYCSTSDSLRLQAIKSFEIVASGQQEEDGRQYMQVLADVETDQTKFVESPNSGIPVEEPIKQVTIQVWESDTFYDLLVASTAKLNELGQRTQTLTGVPQEIRSAPTRDKANQSEYCVFLPFDQFGR